MKTKKNITTIEKAYLKAKELGILEEIMPNHTGNFTIDRQEFKKSWIKKKNTMNFNLLK